VGGNKKSSSLIYSYKAWRKLKSLNRVSEN
jgi:hypothetical protein